MNAGKMRQIYGDKWRDIDMYSLTPQQLVFCYAISVGFNTEQAMKVAGFKRSTTPGILTGRDDIQAVIEVMTLMNSGEREGRKKVCTRNEILATLSDLSRNGPAATKLAASLRLLDYLEQKEARESDSESVVRGLFGDMKAEDIRRLVSSLRGLSTDELQGILKTMKREGK